jgi:hypothetical protein
VESSRKLRFKPTKTGEWQCTGIPGLQCVTFDLFLGTKAAKCAEKRHETKALGLDRKSKTRPVAKSLDRSRRGGGKMEAPNVAELRDLKTFKHF